MHGLSCFVACGIFLDQGSNPYPLHWQVDFFFTTEPPGKPYFILFYGWVIFHCIYVPSLLYRVLCQWKFRQLPCLGCKEPWVAPLFRSLCFKQVCLWLCNQRTVCSEPIPLYTTDDWYHHASWNLKHDALNLPWDTGRNSMRSAILCSLWGCPWGPCLFCHIMSMKRAWREGFSALVSEGEVLILRNEFVFIWRRLWILK